MKPEIDKLANEIAEFEVLINNKHKKLNEIYDELAVLKQALFTKKEEYFQHIPSQNASERTLSNDEILLFSRQMIVSEIGVKGQLAIRKYSVLIAGSGGLGCPAIEYLARAGIKNFGIVDYDTVDINNIHRQILYTSKDIGQSKVEAAKRRILNINPSCNVRTYNGQINRENAMEIINAYDIILDCSDNVATRYLLNDACVMAKKPLVSGSALKLEGQLTVYNYKNGPCYRCLFPNPPNPEAVTNCSDGGILGAVTGIIGSLQALEALKIILNFEDVLSGRLLIFDGSRTIFRNIKLRNKNKTCLVCSDHPEITELIDYEQFCGMKASDKDLELNILKENERISVDEYFEKMVHKRNKLILIDVRSPIEFEICKLENSINIPMKDLLQDKFLNEICENVEKENAEVIVVCRRGNDSQLAVKHLQKLKGITTARDIVGGLYAWQKKIDNNFPIY